MNTLTTLNLLAPMTNSTKLTILLVVLIVFVVLQAVLGIIFIIALRKRRPVVKVIMAPQAKSEDAEGGTGTSNGGVNNTYTSAANTTLPPVGATGTKEENVTPPAKGVDAVVPTKNAEEPVATKPVASEPVTAKSEKAEQDAEIYTVESKDNSKKEQVRLDRSFSADLCQLSNEAKEWYSNLKNELLSYDKVKDRTDWKSETFSIGRTVVARLIVRGKTLCLLLAVEPAGYTGTKYSVENASSIPNMEDTPTLYSIKSALRLRYAKDMIAGFMSEVPTAKNGLYEEKDFYVPYAGDVSLLRRGLIKRVVIDSAQSSKSGESAAQSGNDSGKNTKVGGKK